MKHVAFFLKRAGALQYRTGMLILVVVATSMLVFFSRPANFPAGAIFTVESGASLTIIAHNLKERQMILSALSFKMLAWLTGSESSLQAGEYFFEKPLSMFTLLKRLGGNATGEQIRVVIFEGYDLFDIAELFAQKEFFSKEAFFAVVGAPGANSEAQVHKKMVDFSSLSPLLAGKPQNANLEGYLFPDTYFFIRGIRPEDAVSVMIRNFDEKIEQELREKTEESGRSFFDILTLASLVEKEAPRSYDRRIIAGILWKRLDRGMPLQVDSTLSYIVGRSSLQLTKDDLSIDSPYNTYNRKGLPLGPIANPGIDAIRAALHSVDSPYFFYLSDRNGNIHYAATFDEHKENKLRYIR